MAVEIIIQETLVENGLGKKVVPVFFSAFPVPKEAYENPELKEKYTAKRTAAQNDSNESSVVHPFPDPHYGIVCFYVSSPDKEHTTNIAKAILEGFEIEYKIKE
jgi:hypothetical protein